jgi:quercetin dioxygenase-like cupin family protein
MAQRIIDLESSLAYAPGAVVSKTFVDKKAGTVTLFAFDKGQGLSEHTAPFDAIVQILDGEARVRIGASTMKVGAGSMVILPAGVPHALRAAKRFKMLLIMIK